MPPWPYRVRANPIAQAVIGPVFVASFGHDVQNAVGREKFFADARERRVDQVDLTEAIPEEHAASAEIFQAGPPLSTQNQSLAADGRNGVEARGGFNRSWPRLCKQQELLGADLWK